MTTAILIAAAGVVIAWPWIFAEAKKLWASGLLQKLDVRHYAAGLLLAGALLTWSRPADSEPTPAPEPDNAELSLRGLFISPTAADDAQLLSALCEEIASCIEFDANREGGPRLTTGVAFDDLRMAAREARMRGESLGARQPHVRDALHKFLDERVGHSGGPVSPEQRSRWVAAYREIARAAANATK